MVKKKMYRIVRVYQSEHAAQSGALDLGLFLAAKKDKGNIPNIHVEQATDQTEWYVKVPVDAYGEAKKWKGR